MQKSHIFLCIALSIASLLGYYLFVYAEIVQFNLVEAPLGKEVPCTAVACTATPCTPTACTATPCTAVPCTAVPCTTTDATKGEIQSQKEKEKECPVLPTCPACPACPTNPPSPPATNTAPSCKGDFCRKRETPRLMVDMFFFSHELDWLDIRLGELYDYTDYFVLLEGENTYQGTTKKLYYQENKERYAQYNDKIIWLKNTLPKTTERFKMERQSRVFIAKEGYKALEARMKEDKLPSYAPEDIIITFADLDELVRPSLLHKLRWYDPVPALPAVVDHHFYYYNFYWQYKRGWSGARIITGRNYLDYPNAVWHHYDYQNSGENIKTYLRGAGWHCSSCLSAKDLQYKIQTFSHVELNTPQITSLENLQYAIDNGKAWMDVKSTDPLSQMYPSPSLGDIPYFIIKNMDKYPYLIPLSKVSKETMYEFYLNYTDSKLIY